MPQRDDEFHQVLIVLEHICDVSRVAGILLPILGKIEVNVQPSPSWCQNVDTLET